MGDKTKILIISANPWDTKRISPDEEYKEVQKVLKASKQRDNFELHYTPAAGDEELRQALLDIEPQIVHFSGHGELDGLYFQKADSNKQFVTKDALTRLFGLFANQIKCVVLNACYSEEQAKAISQHIDFVIGMNKAIGDVAAIKFATGFYQAVFNGKEIDFAFDFGRSTIDLSNIPEWQTPQLRKKQDNDININQTPKSFLPDYQYDVLIHAAESEKEWAESLVSELKKYLGQKLGIENQCSVGLQTGETNFNQAATIILLLSPGYINQYQNVLTQFPQLNIQKRAFLAEYSAVLPRPESLKGLSKFCFWKLDEQRDTCILATNDKQFSVRSGELAESIVNCLSELQKEQNYRSKLEENCPQLNNCGFVFVDAAPNEDKALIEEVKKHLDQHKIDYFLPIYDSSLSASDIRQYLESNFKESDAILLLCRDAPSLWTTLQVMEYKKIQSKREKTLRVLALALYKNEALNFNLKELKVFHCPPDNIADYIAKFAAEFYKENNAFKEHVSQKSNF